MKKRLLFTLLVVLFIFCSSPVAFAATVENNRLPNPVEDYTDIGTAGKAVGFEIPVPEYITQGYSPSAIQTIDKKTVQLIYTEGENTINYRVAGDTLGADISGDYNTHPVEKKINIEGTDVTLKGENLLTSLAIWQKSGLSFALSFSRPIEDIEFEKIIRSIPEVKAQASKIGILEALVLGLVQGLTEFLPVSSSGHLVLLQKIFGITGDNLFFDVMLHVATLIAVIFALNKEIVAILKNPLGKMLRYIILATIPTVIIALLLKDVIDTAYGGDLLGFGFIFTGLLLTIAEKVPRGTKKLEEMKISSPIIMGLLQGIAIFPAISRSGSTIVGGLISGLDRGFAARFSFLMSIPAILGSLVLEGKDAIEAGLGNLPWLQIIVGMVFAGVSGFFAIRFMINLITNKKLYGFAIYVGALGVLILLDQLFFNIVFQNPFINMLG